MEMTLPTNALDEPEPIKQRNTLSQQEQICKHLKRCAAPGNVLTKIDASKSHIGWKLTYEKPE